MVFSKEFYSLCFACFSWYFMKNKEIEISVKELAQNVSFSMYIESIRIAQEEIKYYLCKLILKKLHEWEECAHICSKKVV